MKDNISKNTVMDDPWTDLKQFTDARISLGRCGTSLPLRESLAFKLAHAEARDAVLQPFDNKGLRDRLADIGLTCVMLHTDTSDRSEYLTRPDKGRRLDAASRKTLDAANSGHDICLVISDGLSSRAVHENAFPFVERFAPLIKKAGLTLSPICIVTNGRVAVADEIGTRLDARLSVILIGERPGLSSPNSLGIYLTYGPQPGNTDETRNCISNIRPGGMSIEEGVRKLAYLVENALALKQSGIGLKDMMTDDYLPFSSVPQLKK